MDVVKEQLRQLNGEVGEKEKKLEEVEGRIDGCIDKQHLANHERVRDRLVKNIDDLNARRKALEEKLFGAAAGVGTSSAAAGGAAAGQGSAAAVGDSATVLLIAKAMRKGLKPIMKVMLMHTFKARSTSSAHSEYRPAALQHYTGEQKPQYATCAVSGVKLLVEDVVAGHIYQQRWPFTNDVEVNDPSNILLMHKKVEHQFDNYAFTVTPVELKVVLLHKERAHKVLFEYIDDGGHQKSVKLGDLDGRLLAVGEGTAPSEYALRVHANIAFQHALERRWCSAADIPPTARCDRELFQGFLRDSASCSGSSGGGSDGGSDGGSGGGSGGSSGGGSGGGSSQDINITGEAGATGEGIPSSRGGNCGSAGASDRVDSDLAAAAQQQLQL